MNTTDILLWGVLPYVVLLIFIGGTIWRYKYDQFGWTTRSSSLYEGKLLRIASPLFHFGILAVLIGHIVGLVIPKSWTDYAGVSEHMYHIMALTIGMFAGFGSAEQTNERFHSLLGAGQTGLSTAFDLPTLMGYDSDHPFSKGEVGKCGVAVSSLADMEILFRGIDPEAVTTSMTSCG